MKLKRYFLSVLMIGICAISAHAGAGKEAILAARSETGRIQLLVKIWDVDGPVSKAQLVIDKDSTDLSAQYDVYTLVDLPNHILTLYFQEKGKPAGTDGAKTLKAWAIPSSFVKTVSSSEYNWRFKIKLSGDLVKEITTLSGTFEWNP